MKIEKRYSSHQLAMHVKPFQAHLNLNYFSSYHLFTKTRNAPHEALTSPLALHSAFVWPSDRIKSYRSCKLTLT